MAFISLMRGSFLKDEFARRFSFRDYEDMLRNSEALWVEEANNWYVTEAGFRRFLVWNEDQIGRVRVEEFESREEALLYLRYTLEEITGYGGIDSGLLEVVLDDSRYVFRERFDVIRDLEYVIRDEIGFVPRSIWVEEGSDFFWGRMWEKGKRIEHLREIPLRLSVMEHGTLWVYEVEGEWVRRLAFDMNFRRLLALGKMVACRRVYFVGGKIFDGITDEFLAEERNGFDAMLLAKERGWEIPVQDDFHFVEGLVEGEWKQLFYHPTYGKRYILATGDLVDELVETRRVE